MRAPGGEPRTVGSDLVDLWLLGADDHASSADGPLITAELSRCDRMGSGSPHRQAEQMSCRNLGLPCTGRAQTARVTNKEECAMDSPDDLLTTAEVALIMRSPVSTLRYWRHLGTGPHSFRLGRRVVYRRADVTAWLHEQAEAGRAERVG
jgi:predicted DNA-binding transcriptional regulator AlpA